MAILFDDKFDNKPLINYRSPKPRYLIITADDFGASEAINSGIFDGIRKGIINTVAAMVTFDNAGKSIKKLRKKHPRIGIGLHLSITSGKPVSPPEKVKTLINKNGMFKNIDEQLSDITKISLLEVKTELENQIDFFKKLKVPIDNLSSQHNILNIYTPFFKIMLHLAEKNKIPVRSALPASLFVKELKNTKTKKRAILMATNLITSNPIAAFYIYKHGNPNEMIKNQELMENKNIIHPDFLVDSIWGDPSPQNLFKTLVNLPNGVSELVFHVGKYEKESDEIIENIETDYFLMREMELILATNKRIKKWMEILNIKPIKYKDLKKIKK